MSQSSLGNMARDTYPATPVLFDPSPSSKVLGRGGRGAGSSPKAVQGRNHLRPEGEINCACKCFNALAF